MPARFATTRTEGRRTLGAEIIATAQMLGVPLMPWQEQVAWVAGEMVQDPDSGLWVPAYPEVGVTVPRQSGKTTLFLAKIVYRLFRWEAFDGRAQSVAYSAQDGGSARKKFKEDMWPLLRRSKFGRLVSKTRFAAENTGLETVNDGNWSVWSSSEAAGHGQTIDLGVLDELFKDQDGRREQAMRPAMATRADGQKLWCSTAGDEKSVILARKVAAGRDAVRRGVNEGIAYFEWGADPEADPEDPVTWRGAMPALGHTVTERTIQAALAESKSTDPSLAEFKRAWLNVAKGEAANTGPIPMSLWVEVSRPDVKPSKQVTFGVDAKKDGDGAAIVAADVDGRLEVVEWRPGGVEWLESRVVALCMKHKAKAAVDVGGPVGYLAPRLKSEYGLDVIEFGTRDMCHASQTFRVAVADKLVRVRANEALTAAVEHAAIRPVSESWMWSRSTVVDASPLLAASIAYTAATRATLLTPVVM